MNSYYANIDVAGAPAFHLVAGFEDQSANAWYILTTLDTRNLVKHVELTGTAQLAEAITCTALRAIS